MMCVTSVPACCPHYNAAGQESQQHGENLHILFTVWSNLPILVHKMFKIPRQTVTRRTASGRGRDR